MDQDPNRDEYTIRCGCWKRNADQSLYDKLKVTHPRKKVVAVVKRVRMLLTCWFPMPM